MRPRGDRADTAAFFSVLWAVAAIFHVLSAPMRYVAFPEPDALGVVTLALGLVAVAILLRPRESRLLVALAVLQLASVWFEAPVLGNHWVIAGFVALGILLAATKVAWRDRTLDAQTVHIAFAPTARWVLLLSYAFAAFAKLNRGFLDPSVSCVVFFLEESAGAVGLGGFVERAPEGVLTAVIATTAAIELAIPVLLFVRRTRLWGVVLAVVFHTVLGLDLAHPFFDFSTLLFALFALFLPPGFATWLRTKLVGDDAALRTGRPLRRLFTDVGRVLLAALVLAAVGPASRQLAVVVLASAYLAWFVYAVIALVAVVRYVLAHRPEGGRDHLRPVMPIATAMVLGLVVLNGLSPYLELKTAFGFNMYSNLVTVAGRSNHLLVPRTLPLTDVQGDLVVIRSSADPDLRWYADNGYALPWRTLATYLAEHPDVSVEYVRDGVVEEHAAGADAAAPPSLPVWQRKLQPFRAVDLADPPRCQDRWGPAN